MGAAGEGFGTSSQLEDGIFGGIRALTATFSELGCSLVSYRLGRSLFIPSFTTSQSSGMERMYSTARFKSASGTHIIKECHAYHRVDMFSRSLCFTL